MRITVHIERLVLAGIAVAHADVPRLREALEQDLAQLLGQGGLAPGLLRGGAVATLTGAAIEPRVLPHRLGEQIAAAVYGTIGTGKLPSPSPVAGEACLEPCRRGAGEGPERNDRSTEARGE